MIRIVILLLTSGALATPLKNDDQKKDKRHSVGALGVSSYNLPYSFAGYPFGLGARIFGAPLSNSLVFAYPFGLEYRNPLYGINPGRDIGSNELPLAAYAYPAGLVSDVGAVSSILNLEHGKTVEVPSSHSVQPRSPGRRSKVGATSIGLIGKRKVSGSVRFLRNRSRFG